jgi:hypothetical protein
MQKNQCGHHHLNKEEGMAMKKMSFFNINGSIGKSAYEEVQFPTAESFVEHLDYLGIERSLVWHVAARDINPSYGNRKLLEEIEDAKLSDRILPAFVITPSCFFEYTTSRFLREHLGSGRVRALQIIPDVSRFEVRQLERLLSCVAEYKPVLLWDCNHRHDEIAIRDFEYLACKFPEMSFVICQRMWGQFNSVMDLLWRCPNTYIDTSWLHMNEIIEVLVEQFGSNRVLFGIGYKSHNGAAISCLMHARITPQQREQIAHSNAESLLKIPSTGKNYAPKSNLLKYKPLWEKFRSGNTLDNVEIIDAHGHTPPLTRGWIFRQSDIKKGIEETIVKMDDLGINRIILTYEPALFGPPLSNQEAEKILKPYRNRLSGYLAFNPLYSEEISPYFDRFFKTGFFVGFKILPDYHGVPLTDPSYIPVWEYADRYKRPILIHTWDGPYDSPSMLSKISKKYRGASFILGHSGGGTRGRLEAEELALSSDNVYLEFCGSFTTPRPFETSLQIVGKEKVLYGSDTIGHDMAWELGRYLSMQVADQDLLPGLATNIKKILSKILMPA